MRFKKTEKTDLPTFSSPPKKGGARLDEQPTMKPAFQNKNGAAIQPPVNSNDKAEKASDQNEKNRSSKTATRKIDTVSTEIRVLKDDAQTSSTLR